VTAISDADAVRFLLQAQFHAGDSDIAAIKSRGVANWLNDSYAQTQGQTGVAWLDSWGYNQVKEDQSFFLAAVR